MFKGSGTDRLPVGSCELEAKLLDTVVAEDLMRGNVELTKTFIDEAQVDLGEHTRLFFEITTRISSAFRERDLAFLLKWVDSNGTILKDSASSISFHLRRLEFVDIVRSGDCMAAVTFARRHFSKCAEEHIDEIQKLMGSLLWSKKPQEAPYAFLKDDEMWKRTEQLFLQGLCVAMGVPPQSPLLITLTAGCMALPTLLKYASLSQSEWDKDVQLPVEIPLGDAFQFHSVFTCPVSKEQASSSNPPVRLKCGHVLCKDSMEGLRRTSTGKFKCPYCPTEQKPGDTQILSIH